MGVIEIKSGADLSISQTTLYKFHHQFPTTKVIIASLKATRPELSEIGVEVLP